MPGTPATQKSGPLTKGVDAGLQNVVKQAGANFNNKNLTFAPPKFGTAAPFSNATNVGLGGIMGYAAGGNPLAGMSVDALKGILGGDMAGRYSDLLANSGNEAFGGALDAQAGHLTDDINRQFSGLGRTSNSAALSGTIAQQVGEARNTALSNQWNQNVANQRGILGDWTNADLQAVQAAPGAWQQGLLPAMAQLQVGAARDAQSQKMLDARTQRYWQNQQAPWQRLNAYSTALGGPASMGGTQSTSTAGSSPLGGLLGGGITGGLAGNQMFGASGTLPGALLGGGLGLASNLLNL